MVLRFVDRTTKDDRGSLGELDRIVRRYFAEHAPMSEEDADTALRVVDHMKENDLWIACDCRPRIEGVPLLSAAEPAQLRRLRLPNPPHAENCCFAVRGGTENQIIGPSRRRPEVGDLAVHGPFAQPVHQRRPRGDRSVAGRRMPGISRVLFALLDAAHVNRFYHGERPTARSQSKRVWGKAKEITLCKDDDGREVKLGSMLTTVTPTGFQIGVNRINELKDRIASCAADWPKGSRPHGFLCGIVTGATERERMKSYALELAGWPRPQYSGTRPHVFAEGLNCVRSPYIGIVSFAMPTPDARKPFGMRSYLQPCLDEDNWFPVDSDYERRTVRAMLDWRDTLPEGYTVDIEKPLYDTVVTMPDGSEIECRPDFVLLVKRSGSYLRHVAVETMGFDRVDYHESKMRTHPAMRANWGVLVQHDMLHRREISIARATNRFLEELTDAVVNGKQPCYPSIDPHRGVPHARH